MSAPRRRSRSAERGFTLVEVLVALTVTLVVVALAWRIVAAVSESTGTAVRAREALDRRVNAHRWLARTLGSLEVGAPGAPGFTGLPDRMVFTAWLETPLGWLEPGPVEIGVEGGQLVAEAGADRVVLMSDVARLDLDYLLEPGAESRWARRWSSPTSAPLAVRFRIGRGEPDAHSCSLLAGGCIDAATSEVRVTTSAEVDTLLYLIGERG